MRDQVTELLTDFGQIDVIWFDFSYPLKEHRGLPGKGRDAWESETLIALVRKLQPNIIVSDRLDLERTAENPPELLTPEQLQPNVAPTFLGHPVRWEACHTMSGSWGYHRDETSWKDAGQLINLLVDTVALGGNLLMNVGPTARGNFDARAQKALGIYGDWLHLNGRAIYGAGASAYKPPNGGKFTQRGNRLYLHVQSWPYRHIHIEGLGGRVSYAQFLHDASEIKMHEPVTGPATSMDVHIAEGSLVLELPVLKPDVVVPVIELILGG
jgi:alpha-L-fucosidase